MYTIVIADDEEELRRAIVRRIPWEQAGFRVVGEAENGVEALEMVSSLEPDLLLTDIRMPFISGIELARQVREIRPATQIAFLSGFDDFSYAQQAIQYNIISYMLKPISMAELTENLRKIREKLDRMFAEFAEKRNPEPDIAGLLVPLLLDGCQTDLTPEREHRLRSRASACGLPEMEKGLLRYVVLTTMLRDGSGNVTEESHVHAVDSILRKYMKYRSFYIEDKVVTVLMATQAAFEKYLHILSDDIMQSIERILNLRCCLGVSRQVEGLTGLHEAYREAVNAMRYASRTSSSIRYISDEEPFGGMDMEYVMNAVSGAEERIKTGTGKEVEEYVRQLFHEVKFNGSSRQKINFLLVELLSAVCRILYAVSQDAGAAQLKADPFMQQMSFLDSPIHEVEEHFLRFCLSARDRIEEEKTVSNMNVCERAVKLIEKNYCCCDISLMTLSSEIGVSPNYLSALLKKKTGKSFVDFLTQQRIEAARKMLRETSMKVREISEACGYSDQHYFSYCFKKYTGVSPNMLRQQLNGGDRA